MNDDYTNGDNVIFDDSNDKDGLTAEKEKQLILLIRNPESSLEDIKMAKGLLVKSVEKYIYFFASYFMRFTSISMEDLKQEGRIGALEAIDKYSFNKGARYTSYAVCWIRQKIQRSVERENKGNRRGIGRVKKEQFNKIKKTEMEFRISRGEQTYIPEEEVAEKSGLSKKRVREFRNLSGSSEVASLNRTLPIGDSGKEIRLCDTLCSDGSEAIDEAAREEAKTKAKESVRKEIEKFSESDQKIITVYLQNECKRGSSKIIAERLDITEQEAARSLKRLIRKLRNSSALSKVFNENCRL